MTPDLPRGCIPGPECSLPRFLGNSQGSDSSSPVSPAPLPTPGNLSGCAAHYPGMVLPPAFYSRGAPSWTPPLPANLTHLQEPRHSPGAGSDTSPLQIPRNLCCTSLEHLPPTPTPHLACQPSLGPGDLPQGFPCCCTSTISFAPELPEGGAGPEVCSDPSTQLWARLNLVGPQFSCL